jgi:TRAP-type mannitol/chloroaromatic compound transport system substrate-binding protein
MIERRRFLAKASGATAAVAGAVIIAPPNVIAQPKVQWRMSTAWNNRALDVQQTAERLAKVVEEMTAGRFRIEVVPGGQIMQPLDCFDAASKGTIEAFMSAPFYWADREPAIQWFHTIPFGMNPEGMTAWLYQGDGLKLMEETYAAFNLVPRPSGAQAPQMGGWFRKKIATLADFKGLRIRIGPLGGKVYVKAGATVTLIPPADIYAALERGVIDASEWVGPADDMQLALHRTARHYYYPGWHEPGSTNEFGFNRKAYEALPIDLRRTLDHATAAMQLHGLTVFHTKNATALQVLKTEYKSKVEVLPFPVAVLRDLKKLAVDVIREESEKTPMAKKVHASFTRFQALVGPWDRVAEGAYHQLVAG